ncbi:nitroreductase family protein [Enterococcus crotali]|uniref:nitroreductase family protein n=1 Tax=Enterococcus crotali TaxID=1453587 RepID=UPI00046F4F2A|nr:nitroreductase family protein [Enterococcus crotali]
MEKSSIEQLIKDRRTIRTLTDRVIPLETLHALLESASYAPYHSKEEPWEVVIVRESQERQVFVKEIMSSYDRLDTWARYDQENLEKAKKRTQDYFLDVPVTLIVTAPICESEKSNLEAIGAVSAFIQNFQLAAWTRQIGVTWRTIPVIFDEVFKENVGVAIDRQIIGLLDITIIDEKLKIPTSRRKPVAQWTKSLNEQVSGMSERNK